MPNSYGSWRTGIQIDNIYPVGSIYLSVNATNPHDLFGGSWEEIQGQFLIGRSSTYTAGSTGGSATMSHTHNIAAQTSGSTTLTIAQTPAHTHTRGSMEITGTARLITTQSSYNTVISTTGAFTFPGEIVVSDGVSQARDISTVSASDQWRAPIEFTASRSWSGATSSVGGDEGHTHSIPAIITGAASNTNNLPPYLAVYMWKRVA